MIFNFNSFGYFGVMNIPVILANVQYSDLGLIYVVTLVTDRMQMCIKNAGGKCFEIEGQKLKNN